MLRFRSSVILVLAVALFASAPAPRFAQQANPPSTNKPPDPPQNPPSAQTNQDVVRINTQLVQVDAVVTDKKGKHVEDLTEADFELLVDGKKQSLTHFSRINLPTLKREPAEKKKADLKLAPESMPARQIA
ncbi:MAG: hypothetical protein ACRD9Y_24905, partial [Blastocatellia bacterium]